MFSIYVFFMLINGCPDYRKRKEHGESEINNFAFLKVDVYVRLI